MKCSYCSTFCESPSRVSGDHFCLYARKMVSSSDPICDEFSIAGNFWCKKRGCQLSVPMCTAAQTKPDLFSECAHCSQKREILDIKRFAGMKKRNNVGHIAEVSSIPPPEQIPVDLPVKTIRRRISV